MALKRLKSEPTSNLRSLSCPQSDPYDSSYSCSKSTDPTLELSGRRTSDYNAILTKTILKVTQKNTKLPSDINMYMC